MPEQGAWVGWLPVQQVPQWIVAGFAMIADNQVAIAKGDMPPYDGEAVVRNLSALIDGAAEGGDES